MRTIQEQLIQKGFTDSREATGASPNTKTLPKPKESLSKREWAEIMGSNQQTYRRSRGGAIRRNR
ncbi:hypothetical protein [Planococcus faecalis]|uniref:Uncharacterized protein n=1 Tax=Planococcus faecalis TaxID=1598147 RepID=A0ABN4XJ96_9BACL|nr:hypothetical protein [Planococcus faecalis]AQU79736.1 hypothetical protein AJGP001_10875 [Planococcus faecalis]OHX52067.1 hypothetical protein BB777_14140 [Planococcus faecalis]